MPASLAVYLLSPEAMDESATRDISKPHGSSALQLLPAICVPLPTKTISGSQVAMVKFVKEWAAMSGFKLDIVHSKRRQGGLSELQYVYLACDHRGTAKTPQGRKRQGTRCLVKLRALEDPKHCWELEYMSPGQQYHNHSAGRQLSKARHPVPTTMPTVQPMFRANGALVNREDIWQDHRTTDYVQDPTPSDFSLTLPALLQSLGGYEIRQEILLAGLLPQKRWDNCGNAYEITLGDTGVNIPVGYEFSCRDKLQHAIDASASLGLIEQTVVEQGALGYSVTGPSRSLVSKAFTTDALDRLGLFWTAYIFPRDHEGVTSSSQSLRKLLLPCIERAWKYVERARPVLAQTIHDSVVEATIAACMIVPALRVKEITSMLTKLLYHGLPDHLRVMIAVRRSVSLRAMGDHDQSDRVLDSIMQTTSTDGTDMRLHCAHGRLRLSRAENAMLRKDFSQAAEYLICWEVRNSPPSELELQIVLLKNTVIGRLERYQGRFEEARNSLEECLKTVPGRESRYHIMHHLADVYCELWAPEEAEKLVLRETQQLRAQGRQGSRAFRRLMLPLAEAYILQRRYPEADVALQELITIYRGMADPDVADQLGHVRSSIGQARIRWYTAQYSEAHDSLEGALALTAKYGTFSKGNFYIGVIYLFLSVVKVELQRECRDVYASAIQILQQPHRYFMPGMGSYFLNELNNLRRLRF